MQTDTASQNLPAAVEPTLAIGRQVEARRARWVVRAVETSGATSLVHLASSVPRREPASRALLTPFDRIAPTHARRPVIVSRRRWMHRLGALCASVRPFDVPVSAAATTVVLLPYQLEPLLAMRAGVAARLLIADEVGLGKTIQAALIVRDLIDRRPLASILIATPAGLRDQWQRELRERTGVDATLADAAWLEAVQNAVPASANPWRLARVLLVSIDFVKRPEILRGLRRVLWDLVVIDEAHAVSPGTDRFDAAATLAASSARLVLLTATPHDGDDRRFRGLCALGRLAADEPLAVFRRTRRVLDDAPGVDAPPRPRTRRLYVRLSPAEVRLHVLLDRYVRRVWREAPESTRGVARLAMSVLVKRAASSPWSLGQSLRRRQALLAGEPPAPAQAELDFGGAPAADDERGDAVHDAVLGVPALVPHHERLWLNLLLAAAAFASVSERKIDALGRLLRRTREPVVVFTEYRDTLLRIATALGRRHAVVSLHGGLDQEARRRTLDAFARGEARVLLATDAGSQGLNLQHRCRLVVHVELPWSPLRLEQRNGRVDRIGQAHRVHVVHLIGRSTFERHVEARLDARRVRIDAAWTTAAPGADAVDPITLLEETFGLRPFATAPPDSPATSPDREPDGLTWPRLATEAADVVQQLAWIRALNRRRHAGEPDGEPGLHVTRVVSGAARRLGLRPGLLCVHRIDVRDAAGAIRETTVSARHLPGPTTMSRRAAWESGRVETTMAALSKQCAEDARWRIDTLRSRADRAERIVRERCSAIFLLRAATRPPDQLELFDDRDRGQGSGRDEAVHAPLPTAVTDDAWSADVSPELAIVLD